jgi:hypothetical protein
MKAMGAWKKSLNGVNNARQYHSGWCSLVSGRNLGPGFQVLVVDVQRRVKMLAKLKSAPRVFR